MRKRQEVRPPLESALPKATGFGRMKRGAQGLLLLSLLLTISEAQAQYDASLNRAADSSLEKRADAVQHLDTTAQVEARARLFRNFVLQSIGGLPRERGALNARSVGNLQADGFEVERIVYDSLPGFHVTADLYLPKVGRPPFPAVLYTPGHYSIGKVEAWNLASAMARNGIAVLAYDPIGEGERLQYFDAETSASLAGKPTGEHSEAAVQIGLTGDHIARYFIWDAMRGIDYLASRQEIDRERIGAFGCSGGGTVTAYLAVLDPRVKAAGVACFITSYSSLLETAGPQEAEQTIPGFIQRGYDFPDWIEAAAPIPYAVISTTEDMFPFEGARRSVEEARRIYGLYSAADRLEWITGPGHHANLQPVYPEIIRFFLHALRPSDDGAPVVASSEPPPPAMSLECTRTGQVSTALGGETLFSLNREAFYAKSRGQRALRSLTDPKVFRTRVQQEVRRITGASATPGRSAVGVSIVAETQRDGYVLENLRYTSTTGAELSGALALPAGRAPKPAVLLLDEQTPEDTVREGSELDMLARSGSIVFAPELSPGAHHREEQKSELLGPFYLASLRAQLVGKTLVGMRVDDVIGCMNWLSARADVNPSLVTGRGTGAMGIVLLHAAALDTRIRAVTMERSLLSYRSAIDAPVSRNLAQSVLPGVLLQYDLEELMAAIAPRKVTLLSPIDGGGHAVGSCEGARALSWVLERDRKEQRAGRVKILVSDATAQGGSEGCDATSQGSPNH